MLLDSVSDGEIEFSIMKKLGIAAIVSIALSQFALADLKVPSSVFGMEELEEAKAKAAKDEEPLIFVYTDPGTT
ncbi:MAG: hypothetical protein ACI8UO_004573 [Verrucomicrobiales bacterium]|jgi:hypothetical protein